MTRFNLLGIIQFGFLTRHNTSDALTEFLNMSYDAISQEGVVVLTALLDFSKAFKQLHIKFYYST